MFLSTLSLLMAVAAVSCKPFEMTLTDVANKTLCPTKISIDEDVGRVPRRIKVIECAAPQESICQRMKLPAADCCAGQRGGHTLGCVQVTDTVMVLSRANKTRYTMEVAVGCVCAVDPSPPGVVVPVATGPTT